MANNRNNRSVYGVGQPKVEVFGAPIIANRYPTKNDKFPVGTTWIQKACNVNNCEYATYILTDIKDNEANWQIIASDAVEKNVASPIATISFDSNRGVATFTGFTTAAGATQVLIMTSQFVFAGVPVIATVSNGGANDAQMTLTRTETKDGSVEFTLTNNGAAALNGDITISFDLMLRAI